MKKNEFTIVSFYKFKKIMNPVKLQNVLKEFCQYHKLKGTILIAKEGINGTIGGIDDSVVIFQNELSKLGFTSLESKLSFYPFMPFYRLKVLYKKEIITFTNKKLDIPNQTAIFVDANKWNKIIKDKNIYLLDVRNNYESKIGTFRNAKKTNTKNFTDFKKYIKNNLLKIK